MKGHVSLEKTIERMVADNCGKGKYVELFSAETQVYVLQNSKSIAAITMEDPELIKYIEDAIEESIRIAILRLGNIEAKQ